MFNEILMENDDDDRVCVCVCVCITATMDFHYHLLLHCSTTYMLSSYILRLYVHSMNNLTLKPVAGNVIFQIAALRLRAYKGKLKLN